MSTLLLRGHVLDALKAMKPETAQCVVTSPPYWGLRDYKTEAQVWGRREGGREQDVCRHEWGEHQTGRVTGGGDRQAQTKWPNGPVPDSPSIRSWCQRCGAWCGSLGLEPTPELYTEHLVEIFREVRRVLRKDGTCWLNLGDSYAGSWGNYHPNSPPGKHGQRLKETARWNRPAYDSQEFLPPTAKLKSLKPKDLVGIPWRVAFALQADGCADLKAVQAIDHVRSELLDEYEGGELPAKVVKVLERLDREYRVVKGDSWWLRADIIWSKPNPMPESVLDRPTKAHEYIFLLTKSKDYFYDAAAIQEPCESGPSDVRKMLESMPRLGEHKDRGRPGSHLGASIPWEGLSRNRRSVWTVSTVPYAGAHFAVFPPALIEPCILAGSQPGQIVLDPFAGSGTTLAVAQGLGRRGVGIELNPDYCQLALTRTLEHPIGLPL